MFFLIGMVLLILGAAIFEAGIRGRVVSKHPHCGACRFDLHGLELGDESRCPECGSLTTPNTPQVRDGLRQRRYKLLVVGVLIVLTGGGALLWPAVSQMQAIKSVDWYAKYPEGLLLLLERGGNDDALQELHNRLIPGEVSDEGLANLIDRAFKHQADIDTPWDERWGDVILYAMYNGHLEKDEIIKIAEESAQYKLVAHERIGPNSEKLVYRFELLQIRGRGSRQFQSDLMGRNRTPWEFTIRDYPHLFDDSEVDWQGEGIVFGGRSWSPYHGGVSTLGRSVSIPKEKGEISIRFPMECILLEKNEELHRWRIEPRHTVVRLETEPQYIEIETDTQVGFEIVTGLFISELMVPTDVVEMAKHQSIRNTTFSFAQIDFQMFEELSLMGTFNYRIEDQEIIGRPVVVSLESGGGIGIWPEHLWGQPGWLKPYIEQAEFWEKVVERGKVDVIYRPDPSLAEMNPGYKRMLGLSFVFRDVPVKPLEPVQESRYRNGQSKMEWQYDTHFTFPRPPKTKAELLEE